MFQLCPRPYTSVKSGWHVPNTGIYEYRDLRLKLCSYDELCDNTTELLIDLNQISAGRYWISKILVSMTGKRLKIVTKVKWYEVRQRLHISILVWLEVHLFCYKITSSR